eukprot:TRINITY_DN22315_c0_g1_i1.p1 TRINITY_DN22315_c0_g1~~TRINITY_DN22315_c0_g1_i1.p1  ORF type:complete len:260 (-),score=61.65 TRINITY_DN22315_c0_g1_i1:36-815(-)
MILRPPRSTLSSSSAASDVYKRQLQAHDLSDKLVNVKLLVALTDRRLYGVSLSRFYVIFKAIDSLIAPHLHTSPLKPLARSCQLFLSSRIAAFESDMRYFLGEHASQCVREAENKSSVRAYVKHLRGLEGEDPVLLVPYAYHLSLAVLSGGQQIKRMVARAMNLPDGEGVATLHYDFGKLGTKSELKKQLKQVVDELGSVLSEEVLIRIEKESVNVFKLNNTIVAEIETSRWWSVALVVSAVVLMLSIVLVGWGWADRL